MAQTDQEIFQRDLESNKHYSTYRLKATLAFASLGSDLSFSKKDTSYHDLPSFSSYLIPNISISREKYTEMYNEICSY